MTAHTTTLPLPAPRVGDRHPSQPGVVWTGWAGWQRCAVSVAVVSADDLADAEAALTDADAEVRTALLLAQAWQREALRLRRELATLRRGTPPGVAAG